MLERIKEAVTETFGEKCPDFDANCHGCQAWAEVEQIEARIAEERRKALADAYQAAHDATTHPSAYACREAIRALSDAPAREQHPDHIANRGEQRTICDECGEANLAHDRAVWTEDGSSSFCPGCAPRSTAPAREVINADAQRCAECDCENGGEDCNWIAAGPAPAREVTVREAALPEIAARWLAAYDASMSGTKPTEEEREISQAIGLAACFAGAAYANEPSEGADVAALARAFLTALMDVAHPDLDYLRADPKAGQVAREVNDKLRALSQGGEG